MPKYTNAFVRPEYFDHGIVDKNGKVVGTIRVKPVSIAWKPAGQHKFYSVPLTVFAEWICTRARKVKQ